MAAVWIPKWITIPEVSRACSELVRCSCKEICRRCKKNVLKQILNAFLCANVNALGTMTLSVRDREYPECMAMQCMPLSVE